MATKSVRPPSQFIQMVPLSHLKKWPRNPKKHDLPGIKASMTKFGFTIPIAIDEKTNQMVAGHGRLEALLELKAEGTSPPKRIALQDGDWMVPVLRGIEFANEAEAEEYLLADNKLTEAGGYDYAVMVPMLEAYHGTAPIGFSPEEVVKIREEYGALVGGANDSKDEEATPEKPKKPTSKLGQLWELGEHRLICGNSTSAPIVSQLFGDEKAVLLSTDPPYGCDYVQKAKDMHGSKTTQKKIANDDLPATKLRAMLIEVFKLAHEHAEGPVPSYIWCGSERFLFEAVMKEVGYHVHQLLTWMKPSFVPGRLHYKPQLEWALYGWLKKRGACPWFGGHAQSNVWTENRENDHIHPTQKPVELFAKALRNNTKVGQICYEPFCGSGSQVIAAEKLSRRCFAIELDPGYCDVIIERWQTFSGKKAKLLTGKK